MFKFKFEKNYQPKQFTESDPAVKPEAAAEAAPAEAAGKPSLFARGQERLQKFGETMRNLRTRAGNFFKKAGETTGAWAKAGAVGILSAPEVGGAVGSKALDMAEPGSALFLKGWNFVGEKMQQGVDFAADVALDTPGYLKEYGARRRDDFDHFVNTTKQNAELLASLTSGYVAETARETRESIGNGVRNMAQWGASALAYAEARRMEAVQEFRRKMDEGRIAQLSAKVEAGERAKAELEAIQGKTDLRDELAAMPELAVAA